MPVDISSSSEPERWIPAHWNKGVSESFVTTLQIGAIDRDGLLGDVIGALNNMRVATHTVNARQTKGGNYVILFSISAESVEHLRSIIARIEKIKGIYSVERIGK